MMNRNKRWYELFTSGNSYASIAKSEGNETTVNMVAGAIFRYRMAMKLPIKFPEKQIFMAKKSKKKSKDEIKLEAAQVKPFHFTFEQLGPDDCQYPYGDGPYTFCGHKRHERSAYCEAHHGLCWHKRKKPTGAMEGLAMNEWRSAKGTEANARRYS